MSSSRWSHGDEEIKTTWNIDPCCCAFFFWYSWLVASKQKRPCSLSYNHLSVEQMFIFLAEFWSLSGSDVLAACVIGQPGTFISSTAPAALLSTKLDLLTLLAPFICSGCQNSFSSLSCYPPPSALAYKYFALFSARSIWTNLHFLRGISKWIEALDQVPPTPFQLLHRFKVLWRPTVSLRSPERTNCLSATLWVMMLICGKRLITWK